MSKESMRHFGLYSDSTMKSMTKDKLIKYVHIIYDNWESCDETSERIVEANMKLLKENELLKRENRALADDNEIKCEIYAEAKKALKRACMKLSEVSQMPIDSEYHAVLPIRSADEWEKEMMKGE